MTEHVYRPASDRIMAMRVLWQAWEPEEQEAAREHLASIPAGQGIWTEAEEDEIFAKMKAPTSKRLWDALLIRAGTVAPGRFVAPNRHYAMYRYIEGMVWIGAREEMALLIWLDGPNCKLFDRDENFKWNVEAFHLKWLKAAKAGAIRVTVTA